MNSSRTQHSALLHSSGNSMFIGVISRSRETRGPYSPYPITYPAFLALQGFINTTIATLAGVIKYGMLLFKFGGNILPNG